jgi:hypothetical protein
MSPLTLFELAPRETRLVTATSIKQIRLLSATNHNLIFLSTSMSRLEQRQDSMVGPIVKTRRVSVSELGYGWKACQRSIPITDSPRSFELKRRFYCLHQAAHHTFLAS